eukprot:269203-Pyramimonas_sp.AAC.1
MGSKLSTGPTVPACPEACREMMLGPRSVRRTRARFLEHGPCVLKQDGLGRNCSQNISRGPQTTT